jgi:hypothetical protein
MSRPIPSGVGIAFVQPMDPDPSCLDRVMWACTKGHSGVTIVGYPVYCPTCCHGDAVPAGFTCSRCGEVGHPRCPTCGQVR